MNDYNPIEGKKSTDVNKFADVLNKKGHTNKRSKDNNQSKKRRNS